LNEESTTHLCYILDTTDNEITEKMENIMEFIKERSPKPVEFELISDNEEIVKQAKELNINSRKYEVL
jgi:hypothetical protein